jgi:prepilin-type N-terminal cleavage/methylation domain-containing protein
VKTVEPITRGTWNRSRNTAGFTLIELIAVMAVMGIMLFIYTPRFHSTIIMDSAKKTSRWLIGTAKILREQAIRDQKRYTLHVSIDAHLMYVTHETMTEDELLAAVESGFPIPQDLTLKDVEFMRRGMVTVGQADITFYKLGHSDKAVIHFETEDGEYLSVLIEPFLTEITLHDVYLAIDG